MTGSSKQQIDTLINAMKMAIDDFTGGTGKIGNFTIDYQPLDDSTAAIDAVTERRVRDALSAATATKATIIIAHRLSSLMHADEIIVLSEGHIVERGTHAELLRTHDGYREAIVTEQDDDPEDA